MRIPDITAAAVEMLKNELDAQLDGKLDAHKNTSLGDF